MKNQNDLIVTIVTVVLALIAITAFWFTKPVVTQPAPPEKVITAKPQFPAGDVQYAASLPGASGNNGAPAGGGLSNRIGPQTSVASGGGPQTSVASGGGGNAAVGR